MNMARLLRSAQRLMLAEFEAQVRGASLRKQQQRQQQRVDADNGNSGSSSNCSVGCGKSYLRRQRQLQRTIMGNSYFSGGCSKQGPVPNINSADRSLL